METKKNRLSEDEFLDFKKKKTARTFLQRALRASSIKKSENCELCGVIKKLSAHHVDYGRPLDVVWLCDSCHGTVHKNEHPLNPVNNKQTPSNCSFRKKEGVMVSVHIPIENLVVLKIIMRDKNISLSKIIRDVIIKQYPVDDGQLEFNFEKIYDNTQQIQNNRIQSLEKDLSSDTGQKQHYLSLCGKKGDNFDTIVEEFPEILRRYGTHS